MSRVLKTLVIGGQCDGGTWEEFVSLGQRKPSQSMIKLNTPNQETDSFAKPRVNDPYNRITYYLYKVERGDTHYWCYINNLSYDALGEWTKDMIYYRLHNHHKKELR